MYEIKVKKKVFLMYFGVHSIENHFHFCRVIIIISLIITTIFIVEKYTYCDL